MRMSWKEDATQKSKERSVGFKSRRMQNDQHTPEARHSDVAHQTVTQHAVTGRYVKLKKAYLRKSAASLRNRISNVDDCPRTDA
jgi:hypothetical protein